MAGILRSSDPEKWEEEERKIREEPSNDEGDIWIIVFVAGLIALGFIFSGIGIVLTIIDNLILKHYIISGILFLFLFRFILKLRTRVIFKIVIIAYCIYGVFTAYTGYKMSSIIDTWAGEYKLVDKTSNFDDVIDNTTKPKKKKKKKTKNVVADSLKIALSFTNSKVINIQEGNIINFAATNKKFNVQPTEYHKHFQRIVSGGDYEKYPVSITANWTDIDNNKKINWVLMRIEKDTLNINLYGDKFNIWAKYVKM